MPGFDGTGPRGMGPMTGGGRGWCNPYGPVYMGGYPAYAPPLTANAAPGLLGAGAGAPMHPWAYRRAPMAIPIAPRLGGMGYGGYGAGMSAFYGGGCYGGGFGRGRGRGHGRGRGGW
jgi:hypothetical protein